MATDKVKVAVRVRPFNRRETELGTESVIEVNDQQEQVILHYPSSVTKGERRQPKVFAFDSCFWSCNEKDPHFANQEKVYKDCGVPVLESAFEGYNACIFAYGQTGSGKSYTMMGTSDNKGLIPRLCDGIFDKIAFNKDPNVNFKVEVSYMEIYNERVHDLLDPRGVKQNLRVREHNILGPYVDGLSTLAVSSFEEIDNLMAEGNKSRTVAATNMNSESSRSHAVFTITLTCSMYNPSSGMSGEKVSKMSLVDLAGSERAVKTGAVGERLKEGSNINKSLTTLGLVISKLADTASGKSRGEQFVPYRDSVLTWLLKDNLGGNSKTVMVATISPAADNYEETLSTLRYADRAKRIVNHAVINEDPNARMIRELKEEVDQLREQLKNATQQEDLRERLAESEKLIKEMTQTWEEKLRRTETVHVERQQALEKMGISVQSSGIKVETDKYYLVNLNADPSLNELLVYYLKERTLVGRSDAPVEQDIQLSGIGIMAEHCSIEIDKVNNELYIIPFEGSRTCVNGSLIKSKTLLKHGDRLLWGNNHFFRVACPRNVSQKVRPSLDNTSVDNSRPIDFEFAREELMMKELSNDPIQSAMKSLELQHEEDKNRALEQQREMYEKQLQILRNQMSPSTPYAPYGFSSVFDPLGISGSRTNLTSPSVQSKMEKWAKERDEIFKKSLAKLKEDIVRANLLVLESNCLAQEMSRNTEFKVTLQIPAANLSPNRKKGAFVSEPAILVKRKNKAPQVWSMEKLENKLIDMRELYSEWKEKGGLQAFRDSSGTADPCLTMVDPFYESQENHHLIGVANVFLEVLFHDVVLDYHVPIISQQGEVAGRLHVEIGRISGFIGERVGDASDSTMSESCTSETISDNCSRNQVVVRIAIKAARGLPVSLSNYVFCQYSFWGTSSDPIVVPPLLNPHDHHPGSPSRSAANCSGNSKEGTNLKFDHVKEFTINITEEFLEHCSEGALSIEVWGHRSVGFSSSRSEWEIADAQTEMSRSLADRWAELKRKIELWVEIQELNEQGEYSPVEVTPRPDNLTGGVYQLRQGQQRRISVKVNPVQDSGTLPVICEAITSIAIGCVCIRSKLQKPLDSYQEEDLCVLNDKWSEALTKRKKYLDEQIQNLINKQDKTEEDHEREQSLIDQWVSLIEERNAVKCPVPGSEIPGAPADWDPPPGMEKHIPVIFLDLNPDDMSNISSVGESLVVAGANSILPKEHGSPFFNLPIVKVCEKEVSATAVWDSSMHDSPALNRVTTANERVYMILKTSVRLSHPSVMDLVLRKRLAINIYKKQSFSQMFKRKLVRSDFQTDTGVTYEVVSNIPKSSEDPEDRETLALMAANCNNEATCDGESYIEKYTKGVSAVESILALDRLRQEVAVKELLTLKGNTDAASSLIRKTASVPNMGLMFGSSMGGSLSRLDHRSDSAFDLSFITSTAYEGIDKIRQKAANYLAGGSTSNLAAASGGYQPESGQLSSSSSGAFPSSSSYGRHSLPSTPSESHAQNSGASRSFVPASPLNSISPHSTKYLKPMKTVIEEHNQAHFDEMEEEEYEEDDDDEVEERDPVEVDEEDGEDEDEEENRKDIGPESRTKTDPRESFSLNTSSSSSSGVCPSDQPESKSSNNNAGTPSIMSSGYGSQPLLGTPVSSEDSISLHSGGSNEETTTASTNDVSSVVEKLSPSQLNNSINRDDLHQRRSSAVKDSLNGRNTTKSPSLSPNTLRAGETKQTSSSVNELTVYSDNDNDSLSSYGSRTDYVSVGDNNNLLLNGSTTLHTLPDWLVIGESVRISPDSKTGVVAFIGTIHDKPGVWVGVELDTPQGKNDGSVDGYQYFSCKPRHGIFVRPEKLKLDSRGRASRAAKLASATDAPSLTSNQSNNLSKSSPQRVRTTAKRR